MIPAKPVERSTMKNILFASLAAAVLTFSGPAVCQAYMQTDLTAEVDALF